MAQILVFGDSIAYGAGDKKEGGWVNRLRKILDKGPFTSPDFYSLVKYLYENNKLRLVMSPYNKTCSSLLKKSAKDKIVFMDNLRAKLEFKNLK